MNPELVGGPRRSYPGWVNYLRINDGGDHRACETRYFFLSSGNLKHEVMIRNGGCDVVSCT